MNRLGGTLLKGLLAILPIGLTVYCVYWLGITAEALLARPIKAVIADANYWPGMGLVTGFVLLFVVGLAVNAFLVRKVLRWGESLVLRIPVIRTIYAAIRDITGLINTGGRKGDLQRVVTVPFGPGRVIGFVTQEHGGALGPGHESDLVAVYLPMSYQIGGYTVYLPRGEIRETDLTVEQAMRVVLTGGVQGH
ncbi:MAG: DUF502 domain-containing protein [Gammaproteobacteria bacterium]|nr:MAG: DUF502 domain-containing protein [Gammaproteobacteria bacterium]